MLSTLSLFSDLSKNELEHLSRITTEVNYKRGEIIFDQGDQNHDFFIIKHGQVEVSVKDFIQEKKVINILKNGEFFGEMALFDKNSSRSATAQAFQNTALFRIPGAEFERILKEQPSISYKLLGTMSKRMKEFMHPTKENVMMKPGKQAKILTMCSPRGGYGKTIMAVTLAQILATELPRKVLFMDLDLNYGDGTFLMGVYSPKSITDLAPALEGNHAGEEILSRYVIKKTSNLGVLPAPKDMLDAERLSGEHLVKVINVCKKYYDYLVIDTNSYVNEHLLNALDMSDQILFLVNAGDSVSIKSNSLFFQAIERLSLPDSHIHLLMSYLGDGQNFEHTRKLFKWPIIGEVPAIADLKAESSLMPYLTDPEGEFCNTIRMVIKSLLGEETIQVATEAGFLSRWFSGGNKIMRAGRKMGLDEGMFSDGDELSISEDACAPMLKEIRNLIAKGFLDNALEECLQVTILCPKSASVLQVLGEIFFMKKDYAHALEVFEKVSILTPENHLALAYLGHLRGNEEMKKQSLQILTARIQKVPDFPDLLNDMGKTLLLFGQPKDAQGFFEKALARNPDYMDARINLAVGFGEMGQRREAIRQLLGIKAKSVKVYYLLGNFFYATGKLFDSMTAYTRVSEINPHYLDTDERLDSLRDYFAKLNNLLEMHKRLVKESPEYPDIRFKTGNLFLMVGQRPAAIAEFKEALRLKPSYEEAQKKLDEVLRDGATLTQTLEDGEITFNGVEFDSKRQSSSPGKSTEQQVSLISQYPPEYQIPGNDQFISNKDSGEKSSQTGSEAPSRWVSPD